METTEAENILNFHSAVLQIWECFWADEGWCYSFIWFKCRCIS